VEITAELVRAWQQNVDFVQADVRAQDLGEGV
jgi:hypothetical protein